MSAEDKAWNDMFDALRAWSSAYKYADPPPRLSLHQTVTKHRQIIEAARRADEAERVHETVSLRIKGDR